MRWMRSKPKYKNNLRVGRPDVTPSLPSHTDGIRQGNRPGSYLEQPGHLADERSTAARSTGIDADRRNPIDPRMPNLSPP